MQIIVLSFTTKQVIFYTNQVHSYKNLQEIQTVVLISHKNLNLFSVLNLLIYLEILVFNFN